MDSNQDIRIVLGSKRYEGAPDTNLSIDLSLDQTTKFENEYDRSQDISLSQVYIDERESSNIFRPSCKFMVLFKNSYYGTTNNYSPFENNLSFLVKDNSEFKSKVISVNPFIKGIAENVLLKTRFKPYLPEDSKTNLDNKLIACGRLKITPGWNAMPVVLLVVP